MDGQLREIGIGDIVVGKHVGKMMGMLGGRLGAYPRRAGESGDFDPAVERNVYRGVAAGGGCDRRMSSREMQAFAAALDAARRCGSGGGRLP